MQTSFIHFASTTPYSFRRTKFSTNGFVALLVVNVAIWFNAILEEANDILNRKHTDRNETGSTNVSEKYNIKDGSEEGNAPIDTIHVYTIPVVIEYALLSLTCLLSIMNWMEHALAKEQSKILEETETSLIDHRKQKGQSIALRTTDSEEAKLPLLNIKEKSQKTDGFCSYVFVLSCGLTLVIIELYLSFAKAATVLALIIFQMTCNMSVPANGQGTAAFHIRRAFENGITDDERNVRYDQFSDVYDDDVRSSNYQGPRVTAEAIATFFPENERQNIRIMDIGAGTGLVGEELLKLGFQNTDALEPSDGMLEKAKDKGVYKNYICDAITEEPLNFPDDTYDVITVVGSHGPNHIKCEAINEMIRLVKPGGYVCIVTRMENFRIVDEYKDKFFPMCDSLEKAGKWTMKKRDPCPYLEGIQGVCICYQVN
ncbi:hypothetical protein FSP39_018440 [Pinctada imbricata]|uniref:Methyltransferase domain-containing protein n=1 Tax=Pinctada imbricata TaxID=66713 RepID=A0AA89BV14_PINIB|nr:hypothetical protein FSP39_018440 [Pinctada imbricata]